MLTIIPYMGNNSFYLTFHTLLLRSLQPTTIKTFYPTQFIACAPQPTEDSSSPADAYNNIDGGVNPTFSDSDDRQEHKLSLKSRQASVFGNLESDSLNENFSPAR